MPEPRWACSICGWVFEKEEDAARCESDAVGEPKFKIGDGFGDPPWVRIVAAPAIWRQYHPRGDGSNFFVHQRRYGVMVDPNNPAGAKPGYKYYSEERLEKIGLYEGDGTTDEDEPEPEPEDD